MSDIMNAFLNDATGIVRTPGQTLGRLMKEKNWVPMFVFLMVTLGIMAFLIYPIQMQKMAEDPRFAEILGEGRAGGLVNTSSFARLFGTFLTLFGMFLSLAVGASFVYLFFGIGGAQGNYGNYFSLVVNASLIDLFFGYILTAVAILLNIDLAALNTPLNMLFSADFQSLPSLILSRFNLLGLWYTVALAAGVSVFSGMKFKKSLMISFLYFLFKAVVAIAFSYIFIQISKQAVGA